MHPPDDALREALRVWLRLDWSDLPFGVYRVLGLWRAEAESLVAATCPTLERLPEAARAALARALAAGPRVPPTPARDGLQFSWEESDAWLALRTEVERDHRARWGGLSLVLRVVEAERERPGQKADARRRLVAVGSPTLTDGVLTVHLARRVPEGPELPTQRALNAALAARILGLCPDGDRRALERILSRATRRSPGCLWLPPDPAARLWEDLRPAVELAPALEPLLRPLVALRAAQETLLLQLFRKRRLLLSPADFGAPATLWWGHNLDALRLMAPSLTGRVRAIYIDPPYNTGDSGFAYTDRFPHAAWLSMMRQSLEAARPLAAPDALIAISINESELGNLLQLCRMLWGEMAFVGLFTVRVRHEGRILKGDKEVHEVTEFLLVYKLGPTARVRGQAVAADDEALYCWEVELRGPPDRVERRGGKDVEVFTPGQFALRQAPGGLKRINLRGTLRKANSSGRFYVAHIEPDKAALRGHLLRVPDMGADGLGARFFWIPPSESRRNNPDYFQGRPLERAPRERPYPNLWDFETQFNRVADEGAVDFRDGKKPVAFLEQVLRLCGVADDKEAIVLDFFAGSGSTAHAVAQLNARDGGRRRAVLVEAGAYAPTLTLPRMAHALRPLGQAPALVELEGFDDTLDAYEGPAGALRYVAGPRLAPLPEPWTTPLRVHRAGEARERAVDLVASLTGLLALEAVSVERADEDLLVVEGLLEGAPARLVWRSCAAWPDARLRARLGAVPAIPTWTNGGPPGPAWGDLEALLSARMFAP